VANLLAGWPGILIPASGNGKTAPVMQAGFMPVRCLIVDDNHDFLRAASHLLEHEGISVVGVASTGAQASRACADLKPDVVLLDIDLGEETGYEVSHQLAGQAGRGLPRVILISAYSADDVEDMIADTPAVSFLHKASLSGTAVRGIFASAGGSERAGTQRDSR
jgi:CheY-like chemotaxis protein